ncbi:MAG: hypothetical protein DCC67_02560 [Planctomycetota bacterium]|nr:MAG: hypothetical protein DCC67_02560 [Planctomycetota bacterium]
MHDQADQLRQLVRATLEGEGMRASGVPIVAVSGSQPGAGATTVACDLARQLARLGKQVILVDAAIAAAPLGFYASPDLARSGLLEVQRAAPRGQTATSALASKGSRHFATLAEVLAGNRRAVEALARTSEDGLRLLPGCRTIAAPPLDRRALERFRAELVALSHEADALIIDAGAGMNSWIDRLWQLARQVLLAATPDDQSFLDAYAAVKLSQHELLEDKLRLVLNQTDEAELAALDRRFTETCRRFLSLTPQPAVALPSCRRSDASDGSDAFTRGVRLLAADLACDFRASSLRSLRPGRRSRVRASSSSGERPLAETPRRRAQRGH